MLEVNNWRLYDVIQQLCATVALLENCLVKAQEYNKRAGRYKVTWFSNVWQQKGGKGKSLIFRPPLFVQDSDTVCEFSFWKPHHYCERTSSWIIKRTFILIAFEAAHQLLFLLRRTSIHLFIDWKLYFFFLKWNKLKAVVCNVGLTAFIFFIVLYWLIRRLRDYLVQKYIGDASGEFPGFYINSNCCVCT